MERRTEARRGGLLVRGMGCGERGVEDAMFMRTRRLAVLLVRLHRILGRQFSGRRSRSMVVASTVLGWC